MHIYGVLIISDVFINKATLLKNFILFFYVSSLAILALFISHQQLSFQQGKVRIFFIIPHQWNKFLFLSRVNIFSLRLQKCLSLSLIEINKKKKNLFDIFPFLHIFYFWFLLIEIYKNFKNLITERNKQYCARENIYS